MRNFTSSEATSGNRFPAVHRYKQQRAASFLAAVFALASVCCLGQSPNLDTTRPLDPARRAVPALEVDIFKNCVVLFQPGFTVMHNDKKNNFEKTEDAAAYIEKNAADLKQRRFYLLIDSGTKLQKTNAVIDVLMRAGITDYKWLNMREFYKPPVAVQQLPSAHRSGRKVRSGRYSRSIVHHKATKAMTADKG